MPYTVQSAKLQCKAHCMYEYILSKNALRLDDPVFEDFVFFLHKILLLYIYEKPEIKNTVPGNVLYCIQGTKKGTYWEM